MSIGKVPDEWRSAIVTPVHKGGLASIISNYRPISLTSVASKVMERVIVVSLLTYLRHRNQISKQQHGFLSGKSTTTNNLESLADWTLTLKNRHLVDILYLDFAKAFNTVYHSKLFHKLRSFGINGNLLKWIQDLLANRTQRIRIGTSLSGSCNLTSGVIQGSRIGPLLFVLHSNDVVNTFNNAIESKLYADDRKLYYEIMDEADNLILQYCRDDVLSWSKKWQLTISFKKCFSMQVGRSNTIPDPKYSLDDCLLPNLTTAKDLGVTIDNKLNFNANIFMITGRAHIRAYLINNCFISRNTVISAGVRYLRKTHSRIRQQYLVTVYYH